MVTVGQRIVLRTEKPVAGGSMLGRHEGQVVLVSGTLPGELVEIAIDSVGRGFARGRAIEVRDPDPDRRVVEGDASCGGATYAHIAYSRQLTLKQAIVQDAFQRIGRRTLEASIAIVPSPERGYRMRARFHVRDGRLGFVREGSHDICDPAGTGQLLPETDRAVAALQPLIADAWREAGAVELSENVPADERVAHVEVRTPPTGLDVEALARAGFTGLTWGTGRATRVFGLPFVTDTISALVGDARRPDVQVSRRATSFFQGNRFVVGALAKCVREQTECDRVIDLYAGVGLHALAHVADGRSGVTAVEGDRQTARDLRDNIRRLGGGAEVRQVAVEAFLQRTAPEPEAAVIVNPPRAGLSAMAVAGLQRLRPARIVYVSCDVATLARDVRRLEATCVLSHLAGFDMFPNTAHVELVAVLRRVD